MGIPNSPPLRTVLGLGVSGERLFFFFFPNSLGKSRFRGFVMSSTSTVLWQGGEGRKYAHTRRSRSFPFLQKKQVLHFILSFTTASVGHGNANGSHGGMQTSPAHHHQLLSCLWLISLTNHSISLLALGLRIFLQVAFLSPLELACTAKSMHRPWVEKHWYI